MQCAIRPTTRPFIAGLIALIVSGADAVAAAPPEIITKNKNVVVFQAQISAATRDQLLALIDDNVNTIVLNSIGGDPLAAIDIGREIRRRNLKVGVLGVCVGSCAHLIFVAARQRIVSPESLVVFERTSTSMLKLIGDAKVPAAVRDRIARRATAEKTFYNELGMSDALLIEPLAQMLTICHRYKAEPEGSDSDIEFASQFLGWTPSKAYMDAVGVHFEGYWPSVPEMADAMKAYHKLFTPNFKWRALGGGTPADSESIEAAYKKARHICSAEELKAP